MKRSFLFALITFFCMVSSHLNAATENPSVISDFLNRIGGDGTSSRIATLLDESLSSDEDVFVISTSNGLPQVQGNSLSAITTGIGWYLNHYVHVNLAWNNGVSADLSSYTFPVPTSSESHTCNADYRYYLNYCTFGYSMTTWTWDRWQHEIDWMALHGINMPLQIIGMEQVWKAFLMEDCGYSEANAEAFVPGPAYIAWWGMNNLQGWGGDGTSESTGMKDDAWYDRQVALAQKILARERELGMQPVLPGFSGMVPYGFTNSISQGTWSSFTRPAILDPTSSTFSTVAANYYKQLKKVMGTSKYYSMDPFHEGTSYSGNFASAYQSIYNAMNTNCGSDTKWVIQQWQWSSNQKLSLTNVPSGRLIVLDLFSDGNPAFDSYNGYSPQEAIYCTIPNFGGRTGLFGRLAKMASNYFSYRNSYSTIKGIGAAPEAIEQTEVAYDLLFELPWMSSTPDTQDWIKDYAYARYGSINDNANTAWEDLRSSCLNNTTTMQGPQEAVICARPSLSVSKVSTWGTCDVFYTKDKVLDAAFKLIDMGAPTDAVGKQNYSYDLTDVTRQALTDYAQTLLNSLQENSSDVSSTAFTTRRDAFLQLILDIDELLGSNRIFRLGNWTATARAAAAEVDGASTATPDWYELNNARQLITTWGDYSNSESSGLRDYSCREWQGMLKDYYYQRWKYWFDNNMTAPSSWFYSEWNWAHETGKAWGATSKGTTGAASTRTYYTAEPEGDTYTIAQKLLNKYFKRVVAADGTVTYQHYLIEYEDQDYDPSDDPDALWSKPEADYCDLSDVQSYSQYLTSLSASVNDGTATTLYSASSCPTTYYHPTSAIAVERGDEVTLSWTAADGLKYCYLSAYLDSDGDGTFDDQPFATLGTANTTNSSVPNNSITFTVPKEIAVTRTHVRLRFDSAWSIPSSANDTAKRNYYEVPLTLDLIGDLNQDGQVDVADVTFLVKIINSNKSLSAE